MCYVGGAIHRGNAKCAIFFEAVFGNLWGNLGWQDSVHFASTLSAKIARGGQRAIGDEAEEEVQAFNNARR